MSGWVMLAKTINRLLATTIPIMHLNLATWPTSPEVYHTMHMHPDSSRIPDTYFSFHFGEHFSGDVEIQFPVRTQCTLSQTIPDLRAVLGLPMESHSSVVKGSEPLWEPESQC